MGIFGDIVSAIPGAGLVEAAVTGRSVQPSDFIPGGKMTPGANAMDQIARGESVTIGSFVPFVGDTVDDVAKKALNAPKAFAGNFSRSIDQTSNNLGNSVNQLTGDVVGGGLNIIGSGLNGAGNIAGNALGGAVNGAFGNQNYDPNMVGGFNQNMIGQQQVQPITQKKDNTIVYVGIGAVTVTVLLATVIIATSGNKKR